MKKVIIGAITCALMATFVSAAPDDDIKARQAAMKAVGAAAKAGDFAAMNEAALVAKAAFMIDTTGQGSVATKSAANIWTDMDGFNVIMDEMISKSATADKSVFGTCKACHSAYRTP